MRMTRLEGSRVLSLPEAIYYIPNFISEKEEAEILQQIAAQPKPKWTVLSHRRLQAHPSALSGENVLLAAPLPSWLSQLISRMQALKLWEAAPHRAPNHVLINEYRPNEGIMPHEDGPAYHPMVATVSLGASIVLDIYEKGEGIARGPRWQILQEPRSLLVTTGGMYTNYLHGITPKAVDEDLTSSTVANWELLGNQDAFAPASYKRETRVSLTYRDVLKVSNAGSRLFGIRR